MKVADMLDAVESLGQPVAYYPSLSRMIGSVTAAIFLCQLIYWNGKERSNDGWIYKTQKEMEAETGLSRREQDGARKTLGLLGIIEEKLAGVPAKMHYRINRDRFNAVWENSEKPQFAQNRQTSLHKTAKPICTKCANYSNREYSREYSNIIPAFCRDNSNSGF